MVKELNERECAHPGCRCRASEGSEYCSESCEEARWQTDCSCGHSECS
jgi:hypothetical protein